MTTFARASCRSWLMQRHDRRRTLVLAMACALPATAQALGLGKASGDPVIGESLQLTIPLTGSIDRNLDNDCISLRRPADAIDAEYFPRDLSSRLESRPDGRVLVLSSRGALRQPLVEFRVTVACGYNLFRDYLLMASPREPAPASVTAPPSAPVMAAPPPAAPAGQGLTLRRSITLDRLARLYGRSRADREQFMEWVVAANPELFAEAADVRNHRLEGGLRLQIPADARRLPPPPPPPPPATRPEDAPASAGTAAAKTAGGTRDRLVVGTDATGARDLKETLALVDRLTGMLEQQVAVQAAAEERIRSLEGTVAELTRQVAQTEASARQREDQWLAEQREMRRVLAERSSQGWINLLIAVLIGGAAGAGLLQIARVLGARRQPEAVFAAADAAPAAALPPTPQEPAAASPPVTPPPPPPLAPTPVPKEAASGSEMPRPQPPAPAVPPAAEPEPTPPGEADPGDWPARTWVNPPEKTWVNGPDKTQQLEPEQETGPLMASLDFPIDFDTPEAVPEPMPESPGEAAIELANIMMSMGLAESAAQTLVEHIRENPRQSLPQWLKLLDLYRSSGKRESFEASAEEMRQHFNIEAATWARPPAAGGRTSLEAYPHVRAELIRRWRQADCAALLTGLLLDNRNGTRSGFPRPVVEEILLLIAIEDSSS